MTTLITESFLPEALETGGYFFLLVLGGWLLYKRDVQQNERQHQTWELHLSQQRKIAEQHQIGYTNVLAKNTEAIEQGSRLFVRIEAMIERFLESFSKVEGSVTKHSDSIKDVINELHSLNERYEHLDNKMTIMFDMHNKKIVALDNSSSASRARGQKWADELNQRLALMEEEMPQKIKQALQND